jgi:hypothetical protein
MNRHLAIGVFVASTIGNGLRNHTTCSIPAPDDQTYHSMISAVHEHSMHLLTLWYAGHDSA